MNANINKYRPEITGKATTLAELSRQAAALSAIRSECEPMADELAFYEAKVNAAAADLSETYHKERVSELLAMGTGSKMWEEFLANRTCKTARVKYDGKSGRYVAAEDSRGRVNYPELNDAYVEAETARMEQAGEIVDPETLTIAADRKFNIYAPLVFADLYKLFIDYNLGAKAAGEKAYTMQTRKGTEVKGKAPSIAQVQKDLDELLYLLLPADLLKKYKLHLVKADVRKMGVAISGSSATVLKAKGDGHAYNWLLNIIQERIENKASTVIVSDAGMEAIHETITPGASEEQKEGAKAAAKKPAAKEPAPKADEKEPA